MIDTKKEKQKAVKIGKVVSDFYEMNLTEVFEKTRKREITIKRQLIFYLCRKHTTLSFQNVSGAFNFYIKGKTYDHATVLHSCNVVQNIMDTNKNFRKEVEFIESKVEKIILIFKKQPLTPQKKELLELRIKILRACRTSLNASMLKNELILVL